MYKEKKKGVDHKQSPLRWLQKAGGEFRGSLHRWCNEGMIKENHDKNSIKEGKKKLSAEGAWSA